MRVFTITEDELASVLFLDKTLEEYPEPYRCEGNVEIDVTFDVYKKFIEKYLKSRDYLATKTSTLRYFLYRREDNELCKCFYKDMAVAIAKELWYTPIDGCPTLITHKISGALKSTEMLVEQMKTSNTRAFSKAHNDLRALMKEHDYVLPVKKLEKTVFGCQWDYACLLYSMSLSGTDGVGFFRWSLERSEQHGEKGTHG